MSDLDGWLDGLRRDGKHHSSGSFTLDLARGVGLTSRFGLARPEEYVLRVVAGALLGGASWLKVSHSGDGLTFEWDGLALDTPEMHEIAAGFLAADPRSRRCVELGIAVNTARRLARGVLLESQEARLRVEDQVLVIESQDSGPPHNRLQLRAEGWRATAGWAHHRLSGRGEEQLIRRRCNLAPLEIRMKAPGRWVPSGQPRRVVQVGDPPMPYPGQLTERVDSPGPWGDGYLTLGSEVGARAVVVHCGVSFFPDWPGLCPGSEVLWWTSGELPLDLSRSHLVQGASLETWQAWVIAKLQQSALQLLEDGVVPGAARGRLVEWLLGGEPEGLKEAPVLRRADRTPTSLAELRRQWDQDGYLPVCRRPWDPRAAWDGSRVVQLDGPEQERLKALFPNLIPVDHLAAEPDPPRLPADGSYLVRMPTPDGLGEVGLHRLPLTTLRVLGPSGWARRTAHPLGVHLASRTPGSKLLLPMVELYSSLVYRARDPRLENDTIVHLLEFFRWLALSLKAVLADAYRRQGPLRAILDPVNRVHIRTPRGKVRLDRLEAMADAVAFESSRGTVSLLDLARQPSTPTGQLVPSVPMAAVRILCYLLPELNEHLPSNTDPMTNVVRGILEAARAGTFPVETGHLLKALLASPKASGRLILERLLGDPDRLTRKLRHDPSPQPGSSWTSAAVEACEMAEALAGGGRYTASEHLLLGLVETPGAAAERLRRAGVSSASIRKHMPEFVEREALADLDGALESETDASRRAVLLTNRCRSLFRRGQYTDALEVATRAVKLDSKNVYALASQAAALGLNGDCTSSARVYRRCLDLDDKQAWLWSDYAESLWLCGETEEARTACREALSQAPEWPDALGILARLSEAAEALSLCDAALKCPDYPPSVWETRADALFALERPEEARQSLQEFVARARPECAWEYDLPQRLARARRVLAGQG